MKINYISDIHLEFGRLLENPSGDEVLVLAGDINVLNRVDWINDIAYDFKHVVYVLGNHEFYRQNLDNTYRKTKEQLVHNVHLLQNESVTLDGVTFHGTTLWSDFEKGNPISYMACDSAMNDFHLIRADNGESRFTPHRAHKEHNVAKLFLIDNVKAGDVVVTHNAPSYKSVAEKFLESKINGAFVSDLSDLILDLEPVVWFHGHCHNTSDYMIGKTRVLNNPRGYDKVELNLEFDVQKTIDI